MSATRIELTQFSVTGLFGRHDISVLIPENKLILVGENGSGKSTIVNMVYFFLTAQWNRLFSVSFDSISATLNGKKYEIVKPSALHSKKEGDTEKIIRQYLETRPSHYWLEHPEMMSRLSSRFEVPVKQIISYIDTKVPTPPTKPMRAIEQAVSKSDTQILFLPTYRRIERDLGAIFPDMPMERDLEYHRRRNKAENYIELVEFGMKDVERTFRNAMVDLKSAFDGDVTRLIGSYLRNIINHEYSRNTVELNTDSAGTLVTDVLSRIDERTLPREERRKLGTLMQTIRSTGQVPKEDRVVAHFLALLVDLQKTQERREEPVRKLAAICNRYLSEKKLIFDPKTFRLYIELENDRISRQISDMIPLHGLSSGEKQIVSLFSHIMLGRQRRYFIIIDEPELSISVGWQRKFLEDVVKTGKCDGLIAVTHSPFVFDNTLDKFAHSMAEFSGKI